MAWPGIEARKAKIIFFIFAALSLLLFNVRYCGEMQTAERGRFESWVGSLSPARLPRDLVIEVSGDQVASNRERVAFSIHDEDSRFRAMRLLEVLREADVVGRVGFDPSLAVRERAGDTRAITIRQGDQVLFTAYFSLEETRRVPALGVLVRLVREFSPAQPLG